MNFFSGFIHTDGRILKDESGKEYILKGMAFGNNVWTNPATPPRDCHHTPDSYRELAAMGFNSVRFYINYGLFEDDENPYVYKESGFRWLDDNISWAKQNGIRIVINMHYPQGGYQSQGEGTELWQNEENRKRLVALWKEIARRYKDEPFIIGYGILNEPVVPAPDPNIGTRKWALLMQDTINAIREVDKAHIIFLENILAFQDEKGIKIDWNSKNDENNFALAANNDNIVYEFHFYSPFTFTHQGFDWADTGEFNKVYPNEQEVFADGVRWLNGTFNGEPCDIDNTEWQYRESDLVTVTEDDQIISYVFQARDIGEDGIAYVDDVEITEFDKNGKPTRIIYANNFDTTCPMYFWANNNIGCGEYVKNHGRKKGGSYLVSGTTDDASGNIGYFRPIKGRSYQASGYFKVCSNNEDATIRPRVDIWTAESISFLNKDFLLKKIKPYIEFSKKHNVPIYCGEFGTGSVSFQDDKGGDRWVSDVIDIFNKYRISYNYHTYHEESFGLYKNSPFDEPGDKNELLYDILKTKNFE